MQGAGFRVQGSGSKIQGSGFKCLEFKRHSIFSADGLTLVLNPKPQSFNPQLSTNDGTMSVSHLQGCLAHKKVPRPINLQRA